MKKLCSVLTALTLILSLTACAQQTGAGASGDPAVSGSGSASQAAPTAAPTPTPDPKEYVVGFDQLTGEQILEAMEGKASLAAELAALEQERLKLEEEEEDVE